MLLPSQIELHDEGLSARQGSTIKNHPSLLHDLPIGCQAVCIDSKGVAMICTIANILWLNAFHIVEVPHIVFNFHMFFL